jgi:hypothetical protein
MIHIALQARFSVLHTRPDTVITAMGNRTEKTLINAKIANSFFISIGEPRLRLKHVHMCYSSPQKASTCTASQCCSLIIMQCLKYVT